MFVLSVTSSPSLLFAGKVGAYQSGDPTLSLFFKEGIRVDLTDLDKHFGYLLSGIDRSREKFYSAGPLEGV